MSELIRSAKSGWKWRSNELDAYNIEVVKCTEVEFFGSRVDTLPLELDSDLLTYEFVYGRDVPDEVSSIVYYLDLASTTGGGGQESAVGDFAARLLEETGYVSKTRLVRQRYNILLETSGVSSHAQADVCIVRKKRMLLLLLQEDKTLRSNKNPEPQVIAEAIAAFQENNRIRDSYDMDPIDTMVFPCITMVGTFPTFYLVPVTRALSECVETSQYPDGKTRVLRHIPNTFRRRSDGMKPKDARTKILQCFEAFKVFVDNLEQMLES